MYILKISKLWVVLVLPALSACVATNPVYHVGKDELPNNLRGALFALPKTRLTLSYVRKTVTFEPGTHTPVVEGCILPWVAGSGTGTFCRQLALLDIKSLRPSLEGGCGDDTTAEEARVSFASFAVAAAPVPDDSQIYVVDLRRNWFQSFDMDLETDAFGVIGKGQSKTVEKAADDALTFGLNVVKRLARYAPSAPEPVAAAALGITQDNPALNAAQKSLDQLKTLLDARAALLAGSDTDSLARNALLLAAQQREIAFLTALFTGNKSVVQDEPKTVSLVPDRIGTEEPLFEYGPCGLTPSHQLVLRASAACTGCNMTPAKPVQLYGTDDKKGWPMRIPQLAKIEIASCVKGACKPGDFKFVAETGIAQFGPVVRLPAKTGGRSSNIAATYSALGSLTKLEVDQEGQAATPIFSALNAALTPSPEQVKPTEVQSLTAQIALIKARQDLCKLIYGADAKVCLTANPPISQ